MQAHVNAWLAEQRFKPRHRPSRRGKECTRRVRASWLPDVPEIPEVFSDEEPKQFLKFDPEELIKEVSTIFLVSVDHLRSEDKRMAISRPRHILMYLLYFHTHWGYRRIGRRLGGRNHKSAVFGVERVAKELTTDRALAKVLQYIRSQCKALT